MSRLSQSWMLVQFIALVTATSIVAGGGQFPGNTAHLIVYLKLILFLLPILGFTLKVLHEKQFTLRHSLCPLIQRHKILILFLISLLLSIPFSSYPSFSLQRCLYTYLGFGSLFCLMAQYDSLPDDKMLYSRSILLCSIIALFALAISCLLPYPSLRMNIQAAGLIHPNMLSSLLAQLFLALIILKRSFIYTLVAALFLGAILALQSRGVCIALTLAVITGLSVNAFFYKNRTALLILAFIAMFICLGLIAIVLQPDLLSDVLPLVSRGQSLEDLLSLSNRLSLWQTLLNGISFKQLLIGHGYALMSPDITVDFGSGIVYGAHNAYLALFLGCGLLSLFLFAVYWLSVILIVFRDRYQLEKQSFLLFVCSFILLMTHALVGEEFGLHLTPTFLLLIFHTQRMLARRSLS